MKKDFSITNRMSLIRESKLTPNELETVTALLMAQEEDCYWEDDAYQTEQEHPKNKRDTEYLLVLQTLLGKQYLREILLSLQNKGVILKTVKLPDPKGDQPLKIDDVKLNKNFLKKYLRHSGEMFWELYNAYPEVCEINGRLMSLRNTFGQGGWSNIDEAASFYAQRIGFNAKTHKEIIQLVEDGKEKGLINSGLVKFLRGEEWRNLENLTTKGGYGNVNTDVNFV